MIARLPTFFDNFLIPNSRIFEFKEKYTVIVDIL